MFVFSFISYPFLFGSPVNPAAVVVQTSLWSEAVVEVLIVGFCLYYQIVAFLEYLIAIIVLPGHVVLVALTWNFLCTVVGVLLATALLTLLERKIMASIQRRRGPNVIGFFGLLQPFADGLKLALKETTVPKLASKPLFIFGPIVAFGLAIFGWALLPFPTWLRSSQNFSGFRSFDLGQPVAGSSAIDVDVGLLFVFVIVALHVYGVLLGGWGSNSRYALLGALRATAQGISYELVMGFALISLSVWHGGFGLLVILNDQSVVWNGVSLLPVFIIYFICALAELNRTPFDLVEAEGELVAGYSTEYSSMMFALFFLGEYVSIIFSGVVVTLLFLGAWVIPVVVFWPICSLLRFCEVFNFFLFIMFVLATLTFVVKATLVIIGSLVVRFVLPRYRYDQLMSIGWQVLLPAMLLVAGTVAVLKLLKNNWIIYEILQQQC